MKPSKQEELKNDVDIRYMLKCNEWAQIPMSMKDKLLHNALDLHEYRMTDKLCKVLSYYVAINEELPIESVNLSHNNIND